MGKITTCPDYGFTGATGYREVHRPALPILPETEGKITVPLAEPKLIRGFGPEPARDWPRECIAGIIPRREHPPAWRKPGLKRQEPVKSTPGKKRGPWEPASGGFSIPLRTARTTKGRVVHREPKQPP